MKQYYLLKCGKEFRFDGEVSFDGKGWSNATGEMTKGKNDDGPIWVKVKCVSFQNDEISVMWISED